MNEVTNALRLCSNWEWLPGCGRDLRRTMAAMPHLDGRPSTVTDTLAGVVPVRPAPDDKHRMVNRHAAAPTTLYADAIDTCRREPSLLTARIVHAARRAC